LIVQELGLLQANAELVS